MLNRAKNAQSWRQVKQVMGGVITDFEQKVRQTSPFVMRGGIPLALCGAQKGLVSIGNGGGHYRSRDLRWLTNERIARSLHNKQSDVNR